MAALAVTVVPIATAQAAPGDLDLTWGGTGNVSTPIASTFNEFASTVLVQPDGKVITIGSAGTAGPASNYHFSLVRYLPNGSLDATFGIGGIAQATVGALSHAKDAVLQSDGKILVAGQYALNVNSPVTRAAVARFESNGTLDPTFGSGGIVLEAFLSGGVQGDSYQGIALHPDGGFVTSGYVGFPSTNNNSLLVRYTDNGTKLWVQVFALGDSCSNQGDTLEDVDVQADGKIVAAGWAIRGCSASSTFALLRVDPATGTLDPTFGTPSPVFPAVLPGQVFADLGGGEIGESLALRPNGEIIVGGAAIKNVAPQGLDFALASFTASGQIIWTTVASMGANPSNPADTPNDQIRGIVLDPNGKIVAAGYAAARGSGVDTDAVVARFNADGTLDTGFGTSGRIINNIVQYDEHAAVALQSDGKIVGAGYSGLRPNNFTSKQNFSVSRYLGDVAAPAVPDAPTDVSAVAGDGQAVVSFTPPASDGGSEITEYIVTASPGNASATGASSPITVTGLDNGTEYTFTVAATNGNGTGAPSDPSDPAVTPTTTGPVLTLPVLDAFEAEGPDGSFVTFEATATDAQDGDVAVTCTPATDEIYAIGETTVECSATDSDGNATTDSFVVVVADTIAPMLSLDESVTVEATGPDGAEVTFGATAEDLVDGNVPVTCDPAEGSVFPLGATSVLCSATDNAGNSRGQLVIVIVQDTTAPELTLPGATLVEATGLDGAVVTFEATAADLVDGDVAVTCAPPSGSVFPLGDTTVLCSAADAAGNASDGSFLVTVEATTGPVIQLPPDQIAEATSPSGAYVAFTATATDDLDGDVPVTCTPTSGDTFPLGDTTVECTAVDSNGNATSGAFTVTVVDTTAPVLSLPADQVVEATGPDGAAAVFEATAHDLVDGAIGVTCEPTAGAVFPFGTTTVQCSASDAAGNTAVGSFMVTVADTAPPALTLPNTTFVEAADADGATVTFEASADDLVDGDIPVTCAPTSGAVFALGDTIVHCSAVDAAGNTSDASFVVTVADTTAPALHLPADQVVEAASVNGAEVTYAATADDAVDGSVAVGCLPASGSVFPIGSTTVECSATDAAGNTRTGGFTVTVGDATGPMLDLPTDRIVEATGPAGAQVSYTPSATDAVDGSLPVTCTPATGTTFGLGSTIVLCSATDSAGNTSEGDFLVTVRDTTAPTLALPAAITAPATSAAGAAVTYDATATDLVAGSVPVSCAPTSGSIFPIGTSTVTCNATDGAGNTIAGAFTVQVINNPTPISTPCKVTGGGYINNPKNSFGFNAQFNARDAAPKGNVTYVDHALGKRFKSTAITSLVCTGTHATILGTGMVNGVSVTFRLEVDDLSKNGANDRFSITWSGYEASGKVRGGNIEIHKTQSGGHGHDDHGDDDDGDGDDDDGDD